MESDIESVLELWRAAGASARVTDTSEDLLRTINSGASLVILAQSGGNMIGTIITSFDGWRANIYPPAVHPDSRRYGLALRVGAVVEQNYPWATGFWDSTEFVLEPLDLRYVRDL